MFRLGIPFVAGVLAALIVDDVAVEVGMASGCLAWFLVLWPIIWSPALVPHPLHLPFLSVLAAFWAAFAILPGGGALAVLLVTDVVNGTAPEWQTQYAWAVLTLPVGLSVSAACSFAGKRLSFADDLPDEPPDDYEHHAASWYQRMHRLGYWAPPAWVWILGALVFALARRHRGR